MAIKIGVSGFGRISRVVIRAAMDMPEIEIAGINVRNADKEYMVYMLKYDTVFGRFPKELDVYEDGIIIDGKRVPVYSESDAANIPWSECGAEYIVEGTGAYNTTEKAMVHINQGAKKVIITAPAKDKTTPTFVMGVNHDEYTKDMTIVSNASCTTNCLAPVCKVIEDQLGHRTGTYVHDPCRNCEAEGSRRKISERLENGKICLWQYHSDQHRRSQGCRSGYPVSRRQNDRDRLSSSDQRCVGDRCKYSVKRVGKL